MERVKKADGSAIEARVSTIDSRHLDHEYRLERADGIRAETGLLEVLRLVRKDDERQFFRARWDQRKDELDIDLIHADGTISQEFKSGRGGWSGHHTTEVSGDFRIFKIEIKSPGGLVFDGMASVMLTRQNYVLERAQVRDLVDATVVRHREV